MPEHITVTNPTNDFTIPKGRVQGPSPTTITIRAGGEFRRYAASFTRPQWMEIVAIDGRTIRQGWIDTLPDDAAAALADAQVA